MNKVKVIFLDISGTVAVEHAPDGVGSLKLGKECIEALNDIVDQTGAGIVITSSLRSRGLRYFQEEFARCNVQGKVLGITGEEQATRDEEIANWLEAHRRRLPVASFVILDDTNDFVSLRKYFLPIPGRTGLTRQHVPAAVNLLGRVQSSPETGELSSPDRA